jgi:hypothetical protein
MLDRSTVLIGADRTPGRAARAFRRIEGLETGQTYRVA